MRFLRDPYRRWIRTMFLFFAWCGVIPLLLIASYYALTTQTDFDPALSQLRTITPSGTSLAWAIRIGSASSHRRTIGFVSTSVGFNVDDAQSQQHRIRVTAGSELDSTYQATYLASFRGSAFPVVMTAFRDVAWDGRVSYDVEINGLRPLRSYLLFLVASSIGGVVFFEIVHEAQQRKKQRAEGSGQSQHLSNV